MVRSNGYSVALRNYEAGLARAQHLYKLEVQRFSDPPRPNELRAVEALRGGAVVLLVASLERYLSDALEEFIEMLAARASVTTHPGIPIELVEYNDFNFFDWLIRESRLSRQNKTIELKRVSQLVANNRFVPEAFSRTRATLGRKLSRPCFDNSACPTHSRGLNRTLGVIFVSHSHRVLRRLLFCQLSGKGMRLLMGVTHC